MPFSRFKKIGFSLLILFLSLTVLLISTEVLFRIFNITDEYQGTSMPKSMFDISSPTTLKSGFEGYLKSAEYNIHVKINSKGIRDIERPYSTPGSVFRILSLGDSYAFGIGVGFEQLYLTILEKNLKTQFKHKIEIIKAGFPGGCTTDYLKYLQEEGYKYEPDMILVNFCLGNDVFSENPSIYSSSPDMQFIDIKQFLKDNTYTYPFLINRVKQIGFLRKIFSSLGIVSNTWGSYILDLLNTKKQDLFNPNWEIVFANIKEINNYAPTSLILIPYREQVDSEALDKYAQLISYDTDSIDVTIPGKKLIKFGRDIDIQVIDLLTDFKKEFNKNGIPLFYAIDPHFNIQGNTVAAHAIEIEFANYYIIENKVMLNGVETSTN